MKRYKIITFNKYENGRGPYVYHLRRVGGLETGDFICTELSNDTKIESDFICAPSTSIGSIKSTETNLLFEIGETTTQGRILSFHLEKARGIAKVSNERNQITNININLLRKIRTNIDMGTVKTVKPITKAALSKTAVIKPTTPSRSQAQKELFSELEVKIIPKESLRLEKFLKKNLPENVKDFLIAFFTKYNTERNTIYVENKEVQTTSGRRRSLGDLYRICQYYYPNVTLTEIVKLLFVTLPAHFKQGFRSSYCGMVRKRVFYYDNGRSNLMEDNYNDEYGKRTEYYLSKIS